jgi:hypothetical protein
MARTCKGPLAMNAKRPCCNPWVQRLSLLWPPAVGCSARSLSPLAGIVPGHGACGIAAHLLVGAVGPVTVAGIISGAVLARLVAFVRVGRWAIRALGDRRCRPWACWSLGCGRPGRAGAHPRYGPCRSAVGLRGPISPSLPALAVRLGRGDRSGGLVSAGRVGGRAVGLVVPFCHRYGGIGSLVEQRVRVSVPWNRSAVFQQAPHPAAPAGLNAPWPVA